MTPAIDLLKKHGITHTVHAYEHDQNIHSYGDEAAIALGIDAERIFKTLVVELNTGKLAVGLVPVSGTLNLKTIASACKAKKACMADTQKVQRSTGYVLGGVSPIAQKKPLTMVVDTSSKKFKTIFVSAGKRGLEIEINAQDLVTLTQANFAEIANAAKKQ